ncbi:DUF2007 domain-containing protein [Stenotrophomonas sp. MMGLT7]|uniref:putative signal transducing protein n=1 Tax=Stenotrophomonas sp. MMGLT7 TaxID=2901227 RepID=UPI001E62765D|nr:DUF2007 domain-containing protein [Stenotrophomonas sp. MMGLT7]
MKVAYRAENLIDAHLVKHALEDAGIPAFVFGESLLGGMGELPLFGVLRVCVADESLPAAEAAVRALDLAGPGDGPISVEDSDPGLLPA